MTRSWKKVVIEMKCECGLMLRSRIALMINDQPMFSSKYEQGSFPHDKKWCEECKGLADSIWVVLK